MTKKRTAEEWKRLRTGGKQKRPKTDREIEDEGLVVYFVGLIVIVLMGIVFAAAGGPT